MPLNVGKGAAEREEGGTPTDIAIIINTNGVKNTLACTLVKGFFFCFFFPPRALALGDDVTRLFARHSLAHGVVIFADVCVVVPCFRKADGQAGKQNRKPKASRSGHKLQRVHTARHLGTFTLAGSLPAATMAARAAVLFP